MVGCNIQRFQIQIDFLFLCQLCTSQQRVIHRAQLDGMRQVVIVIDNDAAISQRVGMNRHAGCANLLSRRDGLLQVVQILALEEY